MIAKNQIKTKEKGQDLDHTVVTEGKGVGQGRTQEGDEDLVQGPERDHIAEDHDQEIVIDHHQGEWIKEEGQGHQDEEVLLARKETECHLQGNGKIVHQAKVLLAVDQAVQDQMKVIQRSVMGQTTIHHRNHQKRQVFRPRETIVSMRRVMSQILPPIQTQILLENPQLNDHHQGEKEGHHLDGSHLEIDMTTEGIIQIRDRGIHLLGEMTIDITVLHALEDPHQDELEGGPLLNHHHHLVEE